MGLGCFFRSSCTQYRILLRTLAAHHQPLPGFTIQRPGQVGVQHESGTPSDPALCPTVVEVFPAVDRAAIRGLICALFPALLCWPLRSARKQRLAASRLLVSPTFYSRCAVSWRLA